jgi:hypothetical protein
MVKKAISGKTKFLGFSVTKSVVTSIPFLA